MLDATAASYTNDNCYVQDTNCIVCAEGYSTADPAAPACIDTNKLYFGEYAANCAGKTNTGECEHCFNGTYLSDSRCCPANYYWNATS